ncbi:MAG: hypothetical protein ACO25F_10280 [Erythrobacter sp.]
MRISGWLAAGLVALGAFSATTAAAGQTLEALDAQLPGTLVNDPSRLDWETYGGDSEVAPVVDPAIPGGGAALRIRVKRAAEFIYVAGANVPLTKTVKRGDTITIGFYARTIEAETADGKGVLRVRFQQNVPPYPGFGEKTVEIGKEWDWYEVTADVEMALRAKDGIVALQYGRTRQTIEIGQTIVVSGANSIASGLPDRKVAAAAPPPPPAAPTPIPVSEPLIPEPLEGSGDLLNDPKGSDWAVTGAAGTMQLRDDPTVWLGKARRFTVAAANADPEALSVRIPINLPMQGGDNLLVAIAGRTEQAATTDGKARVSVKIDDLTPGRGDFAQAEFPLGGDLQLIRLRARSPRNYEGGATQLVLQFASVAQAVDIGPVYVFRAPPAN